MTNEKKLELTLCGMFSHKLQIFSDNKIWTLDKLDRPFRTNDKLFLNIGCRYDEKGFPLTQKSFVMGQVDFKPKLRSISSITKDELKSLSLDFRVMFKSKKDIDLFQFLSFYDSIWLLKNHFNIYDLPKEMYIEKQTIL